MAERIDRAPLLPRSRGFRATTADLADFDATLAQALFQSLTKIAFRLNLAYVKDGSEPVENPLQLATYTVATVPTVADWAGGLIYVSDETGGATVAYSDGTNWKRVYDAATVS